MRTHKWKWNKWYTHYVRVCVKTLTNINRKTDKTDTHYIQVHTWINRTNRDAIKYVYAYIDLLTFEDIQRTHTHAYRIKHPNVWKCMNQCTYENVRICTDIHAYIRVRDATTMMLNDVINTHTQKYIFISFSICTNDVLLR